VFSTCLRNKLGAIPSGACDLLAGFVRGFLAIPAL
jgi:hypothetical protein